MPTIQDLFHRKWKFFWNSVTVKPLVTRSALFQMKIWKMMMFYLYALVFLPPLMTQARHISESGNIFRHVKLISRKLFKICGKYLRAKNKNKSSRHGRVFSLKKQLLPWIEIITAFFYKGRHKRQIYSVRNLRYKICILIDRLFRSQSKNDEMKSISKNWSRCNASLISSSTRCKFLRPNPSLVLTFSASEDGSELWMKETKIEGRIPLRPGREAVGSCRLR